MYNTEQLQEWQDLTIAERLQMISDLCSADLSDDDALAVLHELFFMEMEFGANPKVTDALAMAIAERIDPQIVEKMAEGLGVPSPLAANDAPKKRRTRRKKTADADTDANAAQNDQSALAGADQAETTPKKRTRRKKVADGENTASDVDTDVKAEQSQAETDAPKKRTRRKKSDTQTKGKSRNRQLAQETMLEFVENEQGVMVLREMGSDEMLVSIEFSDKVKEMLGMDVRMVGQAMIHAAIASVVQRQANFWHAHVYDEEPAHYS
ncbi:hypothetical protein NKT77_02810 [Moraxella sp. FZLJ2107]|uniref:hypothetical protein n=1 Tax=unclassified Moraxella TaxID=2685852 RepID=UPI0020C8BB49|nr:MULTISPECIES: hypothetical protein [unclassified Moraxella]UTO05599.1 hypothetical protein NKT77_02810 [Moraxella sp. FZLJ2107]UTO22335.1 hypothetical protein NKU06_11115 [Moraxella sp. FZLJ2109]